MFRYMFVVGAPFGTPGTGPGVELVARTQTSSTTTGIPVVDMKNVEKLLDIPSPRSIVQDVSFNALGTVYQ